MENTNAPSRSAADLAKLVTAAFAVYLSLRLFAIYVTLGRLDVVPLSSWDLGGGTVRDVEVTAVVSQLAVIIAWCFWTYRVVANNRRLGRYHSMGPGWAVGSYFIPIANLWRPLIALREAWHGADLSSPRSDNDPWVERTTAIPGLLLAWWLVYRSAWFYYTVVIKPLDASDPEQWESWQHAWLGANMIDIAGAVLAVIVCWTLTRRQDAFTASGVPRARVAS